MNFSIAILGYLGPETMLPMTSVIAGVMGVVLMFGRNTARWARRAFQAVGRRRVPAPSFPTRRIETRPVGRIARTEAKPTEVAG